MRKQKKVIQRCKFGQPTGAEYKPAIRVRDISSMGTSQKNVDWKTKRMVHTLSQVESRVWYMLRWNDDVEDVREQFPLDLKTTLEIAKKYGFAHPRNDEGELIHMTTDFLVTLKDGRYIAVYVKPDKSSWEENESASKTAYIEKVYWSDYKKIDFKMITNEDVNPIVTGNISIVVPFYQKESVHDDISLLKHKIARKEILLDMGKEYFDFEKLLEQYGGNL